MQTKPDSVYYDQEIASLLNEESQAEIDELIKQFYIDIPQYQKDEIRLDKKREKFVSDFPVSRIMQLSKEEYVVGLGTNDSFCYRLEDDLKDLGDIHGAYSTKFGLYYGSSGADKEKKYRVYGKKFGSTPDEALKNIEEEIVTLIDAGQIGDNEKIRKCKLWPLFRGKILASYYPDKYLNIFTNEHLDYFLVRTGIHLQGNNDVLDKQQALLDWKASQPELQPLSIFLFSKFLYVSFGRPLESVKDEKDLQTQRDKEYPREYATSVKITIDEWQQLLEDKNIFRDSDLELMIRIYKEDNHATTCYDLAAQDGVASQAFITPVVALAKRISDALDLAPVIGEDGNRVWWRILFWGKFRDDSHFEWKLQPKLAKALSALYPDLDLRAINDQEDEKLVVELKPATLNNAAEVFQYKGKAREKAAPIFVNGHKTYPRDRQISVNALTHAEYRCEIEETHPTFIRRNSDKPYTEPHHLVPMAYADQFSVSLDVEENVVSLCSNCHNEIHYGKDAEKLIRKLYKDRKQELETVGINVSLAELLKMYGINKT